MDDQTNTSTASSQADQAKEQPLSMEQELEILAERFPKVAELLKAANKFFRIG
jgi:hypothetical protein